MNNELNIEWLLALQEALMTKDWDSETAVINYVNRTSKVKIIDPAEINQALAIVAKQMKYNYPLRCFINDNLE